MRALAFSLLLIVLLIFAAGIATVVFHLKKYAVPDDKTQFILRVFLAGSTVFFLATLVLFLSVPWDSFSLPSLIP